MKIYIKIYQKLAILIKFKPLNLKFIKLLFYILNSCRKNLDFNLD